MMSNHLAKISVLIGRLHRCDWLFLALLLVGFLLRVYVIDYPLINGEVHRDYLLARSMVVDRHLPLIGHPRGLTGDWLIHNSPVYYYLLAAFLAIRDDLMFLLVVNVLAQLGAILLIYLTARALFGPPAALIAGTLYSFSFWIFYKSLYPRPPYFMDPVLYLSYLLLVLAYLKKHYPLLLAGIFSLVSAVAIHNTALPVVPLFLALAFLLVRRWGGTLRHYLGLATVLALSLLLFYAPPIFYLVKGAPPESIGILETSWVPHRGPILTAWPSEFFSNLSRNISLATNVFFFNQSLPLFSLPNALLATLAASALVYFFGLGRQPKKIYVALALAFFLQPLLFASFLKPELKPAMHHLAAGYGPLMIATAEIIRSVFRARRTLRWAGAALVLLLLATFSNGFDFWSFRPVVSANVQPAPGALLLAQALAAPGAVRIEYRGERFENLRSITAATEAMRREIMEIQKERGDQRFFQTYVHRTKSENEPEEPYVFWLPLEEALGVRLAAVDTERGSRVRIEAEDEYVFLICNSYRSGADQERCKSVFRQKFANHAILKKIYDAHPFVIYVTKRS